MRECVEKELKREKESERKRRGEHHRLKLVIKPLHFIFPINYIFVVAWKSSRYEALSADER